MTITHTAAKDEIFNTSQKVGFEQKSGQSYVFSDKCLVSQLKIQKVYLFTLKN